MIIASARADATVPAAILATNTAHIRLNRCRTKTAFDCMETSLNGCNDFDGEAKVYLAAQAIDVHVDGSAFGIETIAAYALKDHGVRYTRSAAQGYLA
jgi:hypothetical protein